MGNFLKKITTTTLLFIAAALIGQSVSLNSGANRAEAAGKQVIYDFDSATDTGFTANQPQKANWVVADKNDPTKTFTYNIGQYGQSPLQMILGGTTSVVLTGTSPGQFVYGTQTTLKALATKTNITNTKKLYGFRTNSDLDLSYWQDVTVTMSWVAGGAGSYTGFLAKSTTGESENWSLLSAPKQVIDATLAGSLTFTDTANTVFMGKTGVRLALIFGSGATKLAMRNLKIEVSGNPRKTLYMVDDGSLGVANDYGFGVPLDWSKFTLSGHYTLPVSEEIFYGNDTRVSFSTNNFSTTIDKSVNFSYAMVDTSPVDGVDDTNGQRTLYYRLTDTTLTAGLNNVATGSIVINIGARHLTGVKVYDNLTPTFHKYDKYQPNFKLYPLYDNAPDKTTFDGMIPWLDYTMSIPVNSLLLTSGSPNNRLTMKANTSIFVDLPVAVSTARDSGTPSLSVTGQNMAYYRYQKLDITGMIVKGVWSAGADTFPAHSATPVDGTYTVSPANGTELSTLGNNVITVTYHVNGTSVSTTFTVTVDHHIYTFFNHAFTDGTEWGASTTVVYNEAKDGGAATGITNRDGNITNSVAGWSTLSTWVLNTTVNPAVRENGAFAATQLDADNLLFLRFGTLTAGPTSFEFKGKNFPAITNPQNTLNGISRITIDAEAGAAGTLTASVAGIAPTSYAINYGTPVAGSTATMLVDAVNGAYSSYTFYFPYTVIGQIKVSFTNAAEPKFLDLGNFSVVGFNLEPNEQVATFAEMLNHTDICVRTQFEQMKKVYDYIDLTLNLESTLSSYSLNLQTYGGVTPMADVVWAAYNARYGVGGTQPVQTLSENDTASRSATMLAILIASAVTMYFVFEQRKRSAR